MRRSSAPFKWRLPSRRQSDNIVLVPASELASLPEFQRQARQLPAGELLLALPSNSPRLQEVGRSISTSLKQYGQHSTITTIHSNQSS